MIEPHVELTPRLDILERDTWYRYWGSQISFAELYGEYDAWEQMDILVSALVMKQRDAFEALLPEDCHWYPYDGDILGPKGTRVPDADALKDLLLTAAEVVWADFDHIRRTALARWAPKEN